MEPQIRLVGSGFDRMAVNRLPALNNFGTFLKILEVLGKDPSVGMAGTHQWLQPGKSERLHHLFDSGASHHQFCHVVLKFHELYGGVGLQLQ